MITLKDYKITNDYDHFSTVDLIRIVLVSSCDKSVNQLLILKIIRELYNHQYEELEQYGLLFNQDQVIRLYSTIERQFRREKDRYENIPKNHPLKQKFVEFCQILTGHKSIPRLIHRCSNIETYSDLLSKQQARKKQVKNKISKVANILIGSFLLNCDRSFVYQLSIIKQEQTLDERNQYVYYYSELSENEKYKI